MFLAASEVYKCKCLSVGWSVCLSVCIKVEKTILNVDDDDDDNDDYSCNSVNFKVRPSRFCRELDLDNI